MNTRRGFNRFSRALGTSRQWLDRFFFEPAGPLGLVLMRVWIYGFLLWECRRLDYYTWAAVTPALWKPILLLSWLPGPIESSQLLAAAQIAFMAALALCCAGLWFRWSSRAALLLGLFVYGYPHCFGKVSHGQTLSVFALAIFALSHAGRVWSLDAWIARRRGLAPAPATSSEYQWPLRLLQCLMATVFLAAGVAKLRMTGLAWIFSDQMQNMLLTSHYIGKHPPTNLGVWLAQSPLLCQAIAGLTILAELTAPLALLSRGYRWVVIPALCGMQIGIYLTMGISFWHYVALYVIWVEWNELAEGALQRGRQSPLLQRGRHPGIDRPAVLG